MAKRGKVDNAILKRLKRKEEKRRIEYKSVNRFILIVSEGTQTEPNYFEGFKADLPKGVLDQNRIDILGEGKNTQSLVDAVITIRAQRERDTGRQFDQTWAVFDKDDFTAESFNGAILRAEGLERKIDCAWSNEAFELWYCLHFVFINHGMPREDYKARIEKELTDKMGVAFTYEKNLANMYQLLKDQGDQDQAIKWAKSLAGLYGERQDYANHIPRTEVYRLIEKLEELRPNEEEDHPTA